MTFDVTSLISMRHWKALIIVLRLSISSESRGTEVDEEEEGRERRMSLNDHSSLTHSSFALSAISVRSSGSCRPLIISLGATSLVVALA